MKDFFSFFILILFSLTTNQISAQSNLKKGYIITNDKDTITGLIDFRTDKRNASYCRFKQNEHSKVQLYSPYEIFGYRLADEGKYYISKEVEINGVKHRAFLEYLIDGMMSLYYLVYSDKEISEQGFYFFENEDGEMISITKKKDTVVDGKKKEDNHYKGILRYIFQDQPAISNSLNKASFNKGYLIDLTKEYHTLTCTTEQECIEFENDYRKKFMNIKFTIYAGFQSINYKLSPDKLMSSYNFDNSFSPIAGGLMSISDDRWSKSFHFLADVSLSGLKEEKSLTTTTYTRIYKFNTLMINTKLGIKYAYPRGAFRPTASIGFGVTALTNTSAKYLNKYNYQESFQEENADRILASHLIGYTGAIGADYILNNNQAIIFRAGYDFYKNGDEMKMFQVNVGYTF